MKPTAKVMFAVMLARLALRSWIRGKVEHQESISPPGVFRSLATVTFLFYTLFYYARIAVWVKERFHNFPLNFGRDPNWCKAPELKCAFGSRVHEVDYLLQHYKTGNLK